MHREPQLSIDLYRRYLASPAKSETASVPNVHLRLGRLLQKSGDTAGARREYLAAFARLRIQTGSISFREASRPINASDEGQNRYPNLKRA